MAPRKTRAIGIFANSACVVSLILRKSDRPLFPNADVQPANFQGNNLNVCLSLKRSFRSLRIERNQGPLSATSRLYLFCFQGEYFRSALAGDAPIMRGMVFCIIQTPATMTTTELMTTDGPNDQPGTREATSATAAAISPT